MPTLNINGQRVKVDDSFLSLTPEQQNATVDEIAASLGGGEIKPFMGIDLKTAEKSSNIEDRRARPAPAAPQSVPERLMNSTTTTIEGLVSGVPIVGPALQNLTDAIGGTVAQVASGDFGPVLTPDRHAGNTVFQDYVSGARSRRQGRAEADPVARTAGELTSGVGTFLAAGGVPALAEAMGLTGAKVLPMMAASGASTYGLGVGDSLMRGASPQDAMTENVVPALVSAAIPAAGAAIKTAGKAVNENLIRPFMTAANRDNEAIRRIGAAINADGTARGMTAADEAVAQRAGADVANADRFGSAVRSLARTASNISPEARGAFEELTQQRFYTQGKRAVNFVKQLMGGATDDLALQEALRSAARKTNAAAYKAAYDARQAKAIWTPEIRNLLASDTVKAAIREADSVGSDMAALSGSPAIRNPFVFDESGNVVGLRQLKGGGVALPNLEFWDIVQRNLRNTADKASRAGDNSLAMRAGDARRQLLGVLDTAVPEFKAARQGAAGFFGADDAIEAGRMAAKTPKANPEIRRAVDAMKPAEKDAFSVGFSSELIDTINAARDRVNVIESVFGNPSMRERIAIALGPQRARELEAYVRVEQILDKLRQATQGNSTSTQQLIAAGVLGGGAGWLATGDIAQAGSWAWIAATGRRGLQMMGKRVDDQVMKRVAEMLASGDPAQVQRAIQNAALSKAQMDALQGIMQGLSIAARGAVMAVAAQ